MPRESDYENALAALLSVYDPQTAPIMLATQHSIKMTNAEIAAAMKALQLASVVMQMTSNRN